MRKLPPSLLAHPLPTPPSLPQPLLSRAPPAASAWAYVAYRSAALDLMHRSSKSSPLLRVTKSSRTSWKSTKEPRRRKESSRPTKSSRMQRNGIEPQVQSFEQHQPRKIAFSKRFRSRVASVREYEEAIARAEHEAQVELQAQAKVRSRQQFVRRGPAWRN